MGEALKCTSASPVLLFLWWASVSSFLTCWWPLVYCFTGFMQQVYPSNPSYCCPGEPSLILECRFPTEVTAVSWSCTGVTAIYDDYPGHLINNSMFDSGKSYLHVTNSSTLQSQYRCNIFYPNGTTQDLPTNTSNLAAGETPTLTMCLPSYNVCLLYMCT